MKNLIFSFDFVSPYAYLAAERVEELARRHDCRVIWRPVLLAAVLSHNQQLGPAEIPDKRTYTFKNILRIAHDEGLALQPPPGHPFNPLLPLRIAGLRPEGELILHLFRACWKDGRAIDTAPALQGLMDEDTLRAAGTDQAKQRLRENTEAAISEGVFGVPSFTVEKEVFWGFDSLTHLERYLAGRDPVDPAVLERWKNLPVAAGRK